MLKRLVNALRGSARLEVAGPFPERFLNLCAQGGIQFWGVAWLEPTRLRLTVARRDGGRATALGGAGRVRGHPGGGGGGRPPSWPGSGGGTPCWRG